MYKRRPPLKRTYYITTSSIWRPSIIDLRFLGLWLIKQIHACVSVCRCVFSRTFHYYDCFLLIPYYIKIIICLTEYCSKIFTPLFKIYILHNISSVIICKRFFFQLQNTVKILQQVPTFIICKTFCV